MSKSGIGYRAKQLVEIYSPSIWLVEYYGSSEVILLRKRFDLKIYIMPFLGDPIRQRQTITGFTEQAKFHFLT